MAFSAEFNEIINTFCLSFVYLFMLFFALRMVIAGIKQIDHNVLCSLSKSANGA